MHTWEINTIRNKGGREGGREGGIPAPLLLWVVEVGVWAPVATVLLQLSFIHEEPPWLHVPVGYVHTLR